MQSVPVKTLVAPEAYAFLEEIAKIGIHGKTPTEVVSKFISNELERLVITEKILDLSASLKKRSTKKSPARR